jgi:hypothetical protein
MSKKQSSKKSRVARKAKIKRDAREDVSGMRRSERRKKEDPQ